MSGPASPRESRTELRSHGHGVAELDHPLELICGHCGAVGRYNVGTLLIDPTAMHQPDARPGDYAGFSRVVRCRLCHAGDSWEFPRDTMIDLCMLLNTLAGDPPEARPFALGAIRAYDGKLFRYAAEVEDYVRAKIDKEPQRSFLWARLGNIYIRAQEYSRAENAYRKALELNEGDLEAHHGLGAVLAATKRELEAVPHWHTILKRIREARHLSRDLRRYMIQNTIQSLLAAHALHQGAFELLPRYDELLAQAPEDNIVHIELHNLDLGSARDREDLCSVFLGEPIRRHPDFPKRNKERKRDTADPTIRTAARIGRNDPCPCGSGRKYKKCCG